MPERELPPRNALKTLVAGAGEGLKIDIIKVNRPTSKPLWRWRQTRLPVASHPG